MALASSSTPLRLLSMSTLRRGTAIKAATISTPLRAPQSPGFSLHLRTVPFAKQFSTTHSASFNKSITAMAPSTQTLVEVAKSRRTYYNLGRNSPVPDSEIVELVNQAILHIPSSFNTQSTRLVVALHGDHEKVWDVAVEAFKPLVASGAVPQEVFDSQTKPKLDAFKAAYGTVSLFHWYENERRANAVFCRSSFTKIPLTSSPMPRNSLLLVTSFLSGLITPTPCTSGSVCFSFPSTFIGMEYTTDIYPIVWAGLETLGFGANLQHYNPLIDAGLANTFNVPSEWKLRAQLVFGSIESPAGEKQFKPVEERVKVFGAQ